MVSRIDFTTYAHPRNTEHLTIQVDAAINPGNSGGPVLMGNKVIGVAFQGLNNANNTGYVIPTPVIRHFLEDIKDGVYDGYVDMGIQAAPILNPAMRKAFGLPDDEKRRPDRQGAQGVLRRRRAPQRGPADESGRL